MAYWFFQKSRLIFKLLILQNTRHTQLKCLKTVLVRTVCCIIGIAPVVLPVGKFKETFNVFWFILQPLTWEEVIQQRLDCPAHLCFIRT